MTFRPNISAERAQDLLDNGEPGDVLYELRQRGYSRNYADVLTEEEQVRLDAAVDAADEILSLAQDRLEAAAGAEVEDD